MIFKLIEDNELEQRAKKHKLKSKGISPFLKKDASNVPYNIEIFNDSVNLSVNCCEELNKED